MYNKTYLRVITLVILSVSTFSAPAFAGTYSGGSGIEADPYLISTAADMNAIGSEANDWGSHFLLVNDIDLAEFTGTEFNIIGNDTTAFTGVFDGNGHTISNFTYKETLHWPIFHSTLEHTDLIQEELIVIPPPVDINWPPFPQSFGGDGLFARVDGVNAEIKNLTLVDPNIKTFGGHIGALVGYLQNGTLNNCGVEGGIVSKIGGIIITGLSGDVGGLAGYISDGNVLNCHVSNVQLSGGTTGALTPHNKAGTISNCYAIDSVVSGRSFITGGLVTLNSGTILNSYTSGSGDDCGLVGSNFGTISNCHASGSAQWAGLVGFNEGTISNCYATGTVAGNNFAGGLVSGNKGEISNCYATVVVDGNDIIGGLAGYNLGTISNCYATGPVTGDVNAGAFVGFDGGGSYVSCFWDDNINPDLNGIGNTPIPDPNVTGKTTAQMQTKGTFSDAGWDFTTPIWIIHDGLDYPRLWWMGMEVTMRLTPRTLNCRSKGNWFKAHFTMPNGFTISDVDSNREAVVHSFGIESAPVEVFVNEAGLVEVEAVFERESVCSLASDWPEVLTVYGSLGNGNIFYGRSGVRMITPGLNEVAGLASYWLEVGCGSPEWCGGIDMNRDSIVNWLDSPLLLNSQVEFIRK
jgi:hypothetical protein